jgi:hypothetical protein
MSLVLVLPPRAYRISGCMIDDEPKLESTTSEPI